MKRVISLVLIVIFGMVTASAQTLYAVSEDYNGISHKNVECSNQNTMDSSYYEAVKDASYPTESNTDEFNNELVSAPNQIAAGLCNIFLSPFGAGHFYVGQVGRGILDIIFSWTGIPEIVCLIEGIVWLCMTPEQWEAKFGY